MTSFKIVHGCILIQDKIKKYTDQERSGSVEIIAVLENCKMPFSVYFVS